ncbi:hypothetical protein ONS95_013642 [Cadophora gregata]|uniref:uncharacterized protein n=1 Tax=Cadophora gregata TaxID=51156 RepID=UPI0026DCE22B|nr:uncharacterized protein ONS95_013642 [Cadophora gregata]KAK0114140.1 hypothetical protein ONS95_013642 [Cadophora gregata]
MNQTVPKKLDDLPPLVLLCVGDFLSSSSSACLSISSKNLYDTFANKYQACLSTSGPDYIQFLALYAKDLPDHFPCPFCNRLHSNDVVPLPGAPTTNSAPATAAGPACPRIQQSHYSDIEPVTFPQIQVAMKNHKFGDPHGIPLSAFKYTEYYDLARLNGHGFKFTATHSYEGRIYNGEIILRTQIFMRMPYEPIKYKQYHDLIKELQQQHHDNLSHQMRACTLHSTMVTSCLMDDDSETLESFNNQWPRIARTPFGNVGPFECESSTMHIARRQNAAVSITT